MTSEAARRTRLDWFAEGLAYRRRATPLHAARAGVAGAYCAILVAATLLLEHPLALAALGLAVAGAAHGAHARRELAWAARAGVALALFIAAINPFVVRDGVTVVARLGSVPALGQLDMTLEAVVYGCVLGLRALILVCCFAVVTAAVDPDEVLRSLRRVSFHSALTATLATRMVPVLARDGRRLAAGLRCRPDAAEGFAARAAVVRAVAAGALDRALDVAATLELRGYGSRRAAPRVRARPWSRHDVGFAAAAAGIAALALGARLGDLLAFQAYPRLEVGLGWPDAALAAALIVIALLPFAARRGIAP
jgi:energy-coupling factor transport system permease protein